MPSPARPTAQPRWGHSAENATTSGFDPAGWRISQTEPIGSRGYFTQASWRSSMTANACGTPSASWLRRARVWKSPCLSSLRRRIGVMHIGDAPARPASGPSGPPGPGCRPGRFAAVYHGCDPLGGSGGKVTLGPRRGPMRSSATDEAIAGGHGLPHGRGRARRGVAACGAGGVWRWSLMSSLRTAGGSAPGRARFGPRRGRARRSRRAGRAARRPPRRGARRRRRRPRGGSSPCRCATGRSA